MSAQEEIRENEIPVLCAACLIIVTYTRDARIAGIPLPLKKGERNGEESL